MFNYFNVYIHLTKLNYLLYYLKMYTYIRFIINLYLHRLFKNPIKYISIYFMTPDRVSNFQFECVPTIVLKRIKKCLIMVITYLKIIVSIKSSEISCIIFFSLHLLVINSL